VEKNYGEGKTTKGAIGGEEKANQEKKRKPQGERGRVGGEKLGKKREGLGGTDPAKMNPRKL